MSSPVGNRVDGWQTELGKQDLVVDAVYPGGRAGNASDDPLSHLIGVSNSGGFRYLGDKVKPRLLVLTSGMNDPDWPDQMDEVLGRFLYYGDNKKPGRALHDTPRFGNLLLRDVFERAHGDESKRTEVPPILAFTGTGEYRDQRFLGLMVPGAPGLPHTEDLVAIWKTVGGRRFQNYRAIFSVLNVERVPIKWLHAIRDGKSSLSNAPVEWNSWIQHGSMEVLRAERSIDYRTKHEQLPVSPWHRKMLIQIRDHFEDDPYRFERCAGRIAELRLRNVISMDYTRPSRDGGRDATGLFNIGGAISGVTVEFAMEAKCFSESTAVTVAHIARLISRLRFRQFGIIVTTSYVDRTAYKELKEDRHPVIVLCACDIAETLEEAGITDKPRLEHWLSEF